MNTKNIATMIFVGVVVQIAAHQIIKKMEQNND